jgi:hypothetical protein
MPEWITPELRPRPPEPKGSGVAQALRRPSRATVKTRSEWPADWDPAVVLTRPQLGDAEAHGRGG